MKDFALGTFQRLLRNKHTTGAAIVYGGSTVGADIFKLWLPAHSAQIEETAAIVRHAAFIYGMAMAGDSDQSVQISSVNKPTEPKTP